MAAPRTPHIKVEKKECGQRALPAGYGLTQGIAEGVWRVKAITAFPEYPSSGTLGKPLPKAA